MSMEKWALNIRYLIVKIGFAVVSEYIARLNSFFLNCKFWRLAALCTRNRMYRECYWDYFQYSILGWVPRSYYRCGNQDDCLSLSIQANEDEWISGVFWFHWWFQIGLKYGLNFEDSAVILIFSTNDIRWIDGRDPLLPPRSVPTQVRLHE